MRTKHLTLAAAALALTAAGAAHAQTQAPGLWEHTFKMGSGGSEMERAPEPTPASTTRAPGKMSAMVTIWPASFG